jgi:hypothetical protein
VVEGFDCGVFHFKMAYGNELAAVMLMHIPHVLLIMPWFLFRYFYYFKGRFHVANADTTCISYAALACNRCSADTILIQLM